MNRPMDPSGGHMWVRVGQLITHTALRVEKLEDGL